MKENIVIWRNKGSKEKKETRAKKERNIFIKLLHLFTLKTIAGPNSR